MTTITATYMRDHLEEVMQKVVKGQEIVMSHRLIGKVKIVPAYEAAKKREHMAGLKLILKLQKQGKIKFDFDVNRPIKELYAESIAKKYGITEK